MTELKLDALLPETNYTITDSLGHNLYCRFWEVHGKPKAIAFLCHGYGEHSARYGKIASALTKNGVLAFAHDHVGHGLSDGDRVHIDDFMTYINGVVLHAQKVKKEYPGTPMFIVGHSMGGQITVRTLITRPDLFSGAVLIAPLIMFAPELLNPIRIILGRVISKFCPQAPVIKMDTKHICSDPAVVKDFVDDPLCYHGWTKARQACTMLDTTLNTEMRLSEMETPFLVMHGTADHLTYCPGSQKLYDVASSRDKQIRIYEGASHALHDEPGIKHQVIQEIVEWILHRSA